MEGGFGGLKSIVWGSDKGTSGHHRVLSPRGRVWEGIRDPQEGIFFVGAWRGEMGPGGGDPGHGGWIQVFEEKMGVWREDFGA